MLIRIDHFDTRLSFSYLHFSVGTNSVPSIFNSYNAVILNETLYPWGGGGWTIGLGFQTNAKHSVFKIHIYFSLLFTFVIFSST